MLVSIKISEENYERLCEVSGRLRAELKRPVSINETITSLFKKGKLSELAGAWNMSDAEAEDLARHIKKGWASWKTKSALTRIS